MLDYDYLIKNEKSKAYSFVFDKLKEILDKKNYALANKFMKHFLSSIN